jgi:hypothetical protein
LFQDLMLNMLLMGLPLFFWQSMQVLFLWNCCFVLLFR